MSNYCMSKGVFCDMATDFGFCRVTACTKKYHCGAEGERGMIIQIGTEVDESRILWKHNEKDDWHRADIDDLIIAYESRPIRCKDCKYYEIVELNADGTPDKRCKPSICANGWYEYAVERDQNWFCADAEPKETEK